MSHSTPQLPLFKRCLTCGETKSMEEFSRRTASRDGLQMHCKICLSATRKGKRKQSPAAKEKARLRNRQYQLKGRHPKPNSERKKAYSRQYYLLNKERHKQRHERYRQRKAENARQWRLNNPDGVHAHDAVKYAIRTGKLPRATDRACAHCGEPAAQYHHHKGYAREHWLEVTPLCVRCHRIAHL